MDATLYGSYGTPNQVPDTRFPDPFCDIASTYMPQTPMEMLRWAEFIVSSNNLYMQALKRVISYLVTDVEITAKGDDKLGKDEKDKYTDFLNDTLGIRNELVHVGMDVLVYGNSFTSLLLPFTRFLACKTPGCGVEAPLSKIAAAPNMNYRWEGYQFHATCPRCHASGPWRRVDRRSGSHGEVTLKRWNVHEIDIIWEPSRNASRYIWRIPEQDRAEIKRGNLHYLEHVDWEIIEAVRTNQNLLFHPEAIQHLRVDALAGIRNRGWGLSPVLSNFRQAWYVQMLKRLNEAICLDYIIPVRAISPGVRAGATPESSDPYLALGMNGFVSQIEQALSKRRRDPCSFNIFPVPLEYQMLGAEANQLAPKDLLEQGMDDLLNGIGVPVDFYKGTLTLQAAPAALRLFEAHWSHMTHMLNDFLGNLIKQISRQFAWEPAQAKLRRVNYADDLNRQMAQLQLMMSGLISKTTGLRSMDIDYPEELRLSLDEQHMEAEETSRIQEQLEQSTQMQQLNAQTSPQQQAAGGAGGAGGAPPAGGGGGDPSQMQPMQPPSALQEFLTQKKNNPDVPVTPQDLQSQAYAIAQELMTYPDTQRRSSLIELRRVDETMADLVGRQVEQIRNQARNQGGQMLLQQQQQQPAMKAAARHSLRGEIGKANWASFVAKRV